MSLLRRLCLAAVALLSLPLPSAGRVLSVQPKWRLDHGQGHGDLAPQEDHQRHQDDYSIINRHVQCEGDDGKLVSCGFGNNPPRRFVGSWVECDGGSCTPLPSLEREPSGCRGLGTRENCYHFEENDSKGDSECDLECDSGDDSGDADPE